MPTNQSRLLRRAPLIAALAALTLVLCAPQALARYVYTGDYDNDTVSLIDTATNQLVGSPIPAGDGPYTMAITPNGKTLYVGNTGSQDLTVIDTQTNQASGSIPLGGSPATIAVSPDGKSAYVTLSGKDAVLTIDTQTNQIVGSPIAVGNPWGVAFSPDGVTAYVTSLEDDNVLVIDTQSRQIVGSPIPTGEDPINIVFSPDGRTAYVGNETSDDVTVVDTATGQVVGAPIPVGENPWGLALTPDGKKLYVSNETSDDVTVVDTATGQVVGAPIPVGDEPYELAVTPDGKTLYVTNYGDSTVSVIDTQTDQASTTVPVPGGPWQLAIAPNQSPTASFSAGPTFSRPAEAVFFGNHSSDSDGTVTRFDWSFGDGATAPNGGASPTHRYANAGSYPVGLTVTDNEGCSVNMVFTGRTAHCSGSSFATQMQAVNVRVPNNFRFGKLRRKVRRGTARLTIRVPVAGKLVLSGKKVKRAQRKAKRAGRVTLNVLPKRRVKKRLSRKGSVKVRIRVTFSPDGGTPRTKSRSLRLIKR